jgi:hypothetical protein
MLRRTTLETLRLSFDFDYSATDGWLAMSYAWV